MSSSPSPGLMTILANEAGSGSANISPTTPEKKGGKKETVFATPAKVEREARSPGKWRRDEGSSEGISPIKSAETSSQRSSRKRGRRLLDPPPFLELMKEGLVKVGDELTFGDKSGLVMRDGWLEVGRDTLTLEAFITKIANKMNHLEPEEKADILQCGRAAFERVLVNGKSSLWNLSQKQTQLSTTLLVEVSPGPARSRSKSPSPPSGGESLESAPLSFVEEEMEMMMEEEEQAPTDLQAQISTQLPLSLEHEVTAGAVAKLAEVATPPSKKKKQKRKEDGGDADLWDMLMAAPQSSSQKKARGSSVKKTQPVPKEEGVIIILDESSSQEKRYSTPISKHAAASMNSNNNNNSNRRSGALKKRVSPGHSNNNSSDMMFEIQQERQELESAKKFLQQQQQQQQASSPVKKKEQSKEEETWAPPSPKAKGGVSVVPASHKMMANRSKVKSPLVLTSGLNSKEIASSLEWIKRFGGEMVNEWSDRVTHVIIGSKDGKCARSLKYMLGVISGAWIVSFDWIVKSQSAKFLVDEEGFVVTDQLFVDQCENVVMLSKELREQEHELLFEGFEFYFWGPFGRAASASDLALLVKAGGGIVLEEEPKEIPDDQSVMVICSSETITEQQSEEWYKKTGRDPVFSAWIFDCISLMALQSTRNNPRYKKTFLADVKFSIVFQTQNSPGL
jgi:hypothetical protein